MISILGTYQANLLVSSQIGVACDSAEERSHTWYCNFVRKVCASQCPLPRRNLIKISKQLLEHLGGNSSDIYAEIEDAVEGLFEAGDLVELTKVGGDDEDHAAEWVFLSPLAYTIRESGRIYIVGASTCDAHVLPASIASSLIYNGPYRYLANTDSDNQDILSSIGLRSISSSHWHSPSTVLNAEQVIQQAQKRLNTSTSSEATYGVKIISPFVSFDQSYKSRLVAPTIETGFFVGRRPASFGNEHWCFFQMINGSVVKFVDLPLKNNCERACDAAWTLQLALDYVNGRPARFRIETTTQAVHVSFSFPLPLWASRRFRAIEQYSNRSNFSRTFSLAEWESEKKIITEKLWFQEL